MKRIIFSLITGSLVLAQSVFADEESEARARRQEARAEAAAAHENHAAPRVNSAAPRQNFSQRRFVPAQNLNTPNTSVNSVRARRQNYAPGDAAAFNEARRLNRLHYEQRAGRIHGANGNLGANNSANLALNSGPVAGTNPAIAHDRISRNGSGSGGAAAFTPAERAARRAANEAAGRQWNRNSYTDACRYWPRNQHDRDWWCRHYTRIVFINSGYYFWNAGYWYPAFGYDLAYNNYSYDQPIYAYNDLPPDQVVSTVQEALQQEGYYDGELDGDLGPLTRDSIARYQRDHGLIVTSAIDEPTLGALGLL